MNKTDKRPDEMTLEELLEVEKKSPKLTEQEMEEQIVAIATAESRHSGDETATADDIREIVKTNKAIQAI